MNESDWDRIRRAKDAHRDKLAALPFNAKLQVLERLRERTLALNGPPASSAERQSTSNAIFLPLSQQNVGGAIGVGVVGVNASLFGVNASLAVAATALSSTVAKAVVSQAARGAAPASATPDGGTR